jgi:hypothetical protein
MQSVMNFSVASIGLAVVVVLGAQYVYRQMKSKKLTVREYLKELQANLEASAGSLLVTLAASVLVSLIITMVSFRQVWSNDVFHVVFLAALLRDKAEYFLYRVFDV